MRRFSFATLVSTDEGIPVAAHLPFMIRPDAGPNGTLVGHMARANAQWRSFDPAREVLTIFQGDHAYISPSWYLQHPSVPTWNYVVVHAYGLPRIVEDEDAVKRMLREFVHQHESGFQVPWLMDLPPDYESKMIKGIVAFEITITRLQGKFKLSQNRSQTDRQGVIAALGESAGIGKLMSALEKTPASIP
jgi:transcriptional regulator